MATHITFLLYLVLEVTADCICEIHCIELDGFDVNAAHKLSSKVKNSQREKSWLSRDLNPLGSFLCVTQPPPPPGHT